MKPQALALFAAIAASPALAHPGAHLHPHGAGDWFTIALALGLIAVAAIVMVRK